MEYIHYKPLEKYIKKRKYFNGIMQYSIQFLQNKKLLNLLKSYQWL